jgi:hypothetical protein
MHSIPKFYNPVIHPVESDKEKVLSSKDIFQRKQLSAFKAQKDLREVNKASKVETETTTDSMTVNSQKTPLDTVSITSRDERDRI